MDPTEYVLMGNRSYRPKQLCEVRKSVDFIASWRAKGGDGHVRVFGGSRMAIVCRFMSVDGEAPVLGSVS